VSCVPVPAVLSVAPVPELSEVPVESAVPEFAEAPDVSAVAYTLADRHGLISDKLNTADVSNKTFPNFLFIFTPLKNTK
jgi:hypothetical protein